MAPSSDKTDIKELTKNELTAWLEARGIEPYRAGQILKWIYTRQADTFDMMTDLGKDARKLLSYHFAIERIEKMRVETSKDGSMKYLFRLGDGNHIESVVIPEKDHCTLCLSSQVGCAQGCRFCLTARGGLVRNLKAGEIIAQIQEVRNDLDDLKSLKNIVLMGMGEPLANYRNVVKAIHVITDSEAGLKFSNRRVTISTAGLVPKLSDLGRDTKANLAVSLNATDNRTRSMLMPINKKYPIEQLLDACRRYHLPPRRRITFEYVLIKSVNDSPEDATRLAGLIRPIRSKINLIPFNEYQGSKFKRPEESTIRRFQEILIDRKYTAVIRHSRGQDISGACGQLNANVRDIYPHKR